MNQYSLDKFSKDLHQLDISLTEQQYKQFIQYYELLVEWNEKMNLTAITEYDDVMKKHFTDSLSLVRAYDIRKSVSVIDVGTGAGFPGLVLKIAFPHLNITLLDSLQKRICFLDAVIEKLGITEVQTIHGRAEEYAKPGKLRESFDLCVSRAVANLATLSEYCLPFVKKNGIFISYKSEKISQELAHANKAISVLGGRLTGQIEFNLPNSDIYRNLVIIQKEQNTPNKYPRKAGLPNKEPL